MLNAQMRITKLIPRKLSLLNNIIMYVHVLSIMLKSKAMRKLFGHLASWLM